MVSADGIVYKQPQTLAYLDFSDEERPFGAQLFGSNPVMMAKAVEVAMAYKPDFIDINMGCPVKKVIKRGAGGALMQNMPVAASIVAEVRKAMPNDMLLSVKFRSGIDINNLNYLDFGQAMQDSGADLVTLHPRTLKQMFTGVSNWQHITELKKHLSIPVVGNGDINSVEDGNAMFEQTGCDSIMLGRGSLGKPWIFTQIKQALADGYSEDIAMQQRLITLFKQIDYSLLIKSEIRTVREIRAHLCHYTKGMKGSAKLRDRINHTETVPELKDILAEAFEQNQIT
jgi:nifR3 family TIM-barrel protein